MELYTLWKGLMQCGTDVPFWQEFYVKFYQAFIEANRWQQYLKGVGSTLMVTALALLIGVILGVIVAIIRSAHDQQRPGKKNIFLEFFNSICKVYVTVIRGTPMLVQLLIMGFVIFKSSRSYTAIGILTLGINSGAYVAEIIRGGLMSLDPGQAEAGRSLGLTYVDTMRFIVVPQAFKAILPSLGNEFIILLKDTSLITVIGGKELVYLSSADWMPRNLDRRVETMFPIEQADLKQKIRDILDLYLKDNAKSWYLQPDGTYLKRKVKPRQRVHAQLTLLQHVHQQYKHDAPKQLQPRHAPERTSSDAEVVLSED